MTTASTGTTVASMKSEQAFRSVGGEVPDALADDFDRAVERSGLVKKRAIAVALGWFIEASHADQMAMYRRVYDRYYPALAATEPEAPDVDREAADRIRKSAESEEHRDTHDRRRRKADSA